MLLKRLAALGTRGTGPAAQRWEGLVFSGALLLQELTFTRTSDLSSAQNRQHIDTQLINQNSERIGVAVFGFLSRFCQPLSSSTFTQLTIIQRINFRQRRIGVVIRPERLSTPSSYAVANTAAVTQVVLRKGTRTLTRGGPAAESATSRALPEKPSP